MSLYAICVPYIYYVYFAFNDIFRPSKGAEGIALYAISFCIISFIIFLWCMISKTFTIRELTYIVTLGFVLTFIFMTRSFYGFVPLNAHNALLMFGLYAIPSFIMGMVVARNGMLTSMIKWTDIIVVFFTISVFNALTLSFAVRNIGEINFGGSGYQTMSYVGAFAFGLNLFMILFNSKIAVWGFLKTPFYATLRIIIIPVLIAGVIFGGGKGAFVLCGIFVLVAIAFDFHTNKNKLSSLGKAFILILAAAILMPLLLKIPQIERGFFRATAFISPEGGLNWQGTSGRDILYSEVWNLFKQSPLLGYGITGIFYIRTGNGYSHNIFLDILIDGGLLYLTIFIVFLINFLHKLFHLIKIDINNSFFLFIFLSGIVFNMFSGNYLSNAMLFFSFGYVFTATIYTKGLPKPVIKFNIIHGKETE